MSATVESIEASIPLVATDSVPAEETTDVVEQGNGKLVMQAEEGDQPMEEEEKPEEGAVEIQDSVMEDTGEQGKKEEEGDVKAEEVDQEQQAEEAVVAATEGKAEQPEAAAVEAAEEAVPDVKEEAAEGDVKVKKEVVEEDEEAAKEPQAKKQRTDGDPATSGSPSCDADANKQDEDAKTSSHERKEDIKSVRNSDRDTPPASEEPRSHRSVRGSSRKAVASRQLINKNFLKAVLPNITRLSRTEILQDLRMMEGNAKTRA